MSDTKFKREDNGKLVDVDFLTALNQDSFGWVTLPDGVRARRHVIPAPPKEATPIPIGGKQNPVISENMGFSAKQFEEKEATRKALGFKSVEFVKDPTYDKFYLVKFNNAKERTRYLKMHGQVDKSSVNGGGKSFLSPDQIAEIEAKAQEIRKARSGDSN